MRSGRYSLIAEDGKVTVINLEKEEGLRSFQSRYWNPQTPQKKTPLGAFFL